MTRFGWCGGDPRKVKAWCWVVGRTPREGVKKTRGLGGPPERCRRGAGWLGGPGLWVMVNVLACRPPQKVEDFVLGGWAATTRR